MTHARDSAHGSRVGSRGYLAIGAVAALLALLATPALAMAGVLGFVPGLILSVAAPGAFALVGLGAAVQSHRLGATGQGILLVALTVLFALVGTAYGLLTVF